MNRSDAGKKGYEKTKSKLDAHREKRTREAIEKYEANPNFCPNCGQVIPFEKRRNKFCNQSCAASYNNQGQVRVETVNPIECANCGKVKETRQNKYCDECAESHFYHIPESPEEILSEKGIRAYLLRTREHKCEECGLEEWRGCEIPLEVHHTDGNPDNNTDANLKLLCPNCHAITDNFKAKARVTGKKGRYSRRRIVRRKRYSDGKSW